MDTSITPPLSSRSRSSSVDSLDEEYFLKTYVPLSNLPTPPLSSHSNQISLDQSTKDAILLSEYLEPELIGAAIHLTNLIPSSSSLTAASVPLVHAILTRAELPLEVYALAVCILDSLNSRFALSWRQGLPLGLCDSGKQHIDSIHPEVIVLSAIIIAVKFLDDRQWDTAHCELCWGDDVWSCHQINFTQRAILENIGYRLLGLCRKEFIQGALEDMGKAAQQRASSGYLS